MRPAVHREDRTDRLTNPRVCVPSMMFKVYANIYGTQSTGTPPMIYGQINVRSAENTDRKRPRNTSAQQYIRNLLYGYLFGGGDQVCSNAMLRRNIIS